MLNLYINQYFSYCSAFVTAEPCYSS